MREGEKGEKAEGAGGEGSMRTKTDQDDIQNSGSK